MNRKLMLALLVVLTLQTVVWHKNLVVAQENDTTPPPATESADEETTQNLKKRIERVVQDKKDQIEDVVANLNRQRLGFVGQVQRLSENSITIKNPKGTQILAISDAVSLTKAGKTIKMSSIEVDDWVAVVGTTQENEFVPETIAVSDTSLRPADSEVLLGGVSDLSSSKINVTSRLDETQHSFSLTKSTQYQDLSGQEIKLADLEEQMQVLVVGTQDGETKKARLVRVLTNIE